jgi:hypothetical protein
MSKTTCVEVICKFCEVVIAVFGDLYLREPTVVDTVGLLLINEVREFSGMNGSIDCMHLKEKNYPFAWQWQYTRHAEGCTFILEVAASRGMACSHNNINLL